MTNCDDCTSIIKLGFQVDSLELLLQKYKVEVDGISQLQNTRDIEHEAMIQGLTNRMDNVTTELTELKRSMDSKFDTFDKSVSDRFDKIELSIPKLFDQTVNALLAKIAKRMLLLLGFVIIIVAFALTKPILIEALHELEKVITKTEVVE